MKKVILPIIFCIIATGVNAQNANEILKKVTEKFKSYNTVALNFDYSMINTQMGIDEKDNGTLELKKSKYIVTLKQLGVEVYSDSKNIYTYNTFANELTISSIDDSDQLMNPATLLSIYEKGFDAKYLGEKNINGVICYQLELTPTMKNSVDFSKAEVCIDKNAMFIKQAKMFVDGGTQYILTFNKLITNEKIADSKFTFNKAAHSGIEINDFR